MTAKDFNNNILFSIRPYLYFKMWVFDDKIKGLIREPLIDTTDEFIAYILDKKYGVKHCPSFTLFFSASQFKNSEYKLNKAGNAYAVDGSVDFINDKGTKEVFLCKALKHYFTTAPENIYLKIKL